MTDTNFRTRLKYYARPAQPLEGNLITALAALYIGDGLREIATAIANYSPMSLSQKQIAKEAEAAGECWSCRHWIKTITTSGQLGYCDLAGSPTNTVDARGKCTGFANE